MSAATSQQPTTPDQPASGPAAWLFKSAQKLNASAGMLVLRKGDQPTVMAQFPSSGAFDPQVFKAACQVLVTHRVLQRLPHPEGGNYDVIVAVLCRISGRPAALAFRVNGLGEAGERELLVSINRHVLRRADDPKLIPAESSAQHPLSSSLSPSEQMPATQHLMSHVIEHDRRVSARAAKPVGALSRGRRWLGSLCLGALLIVAGVLLSQPFSISAPATVEAREQQVLVASFAGVLAQVDRRPGDLVSAGEVIGRFDVAQLEIERLQWVGERDKLTKEHQASLALQDRSATRLLEAQRIQAQSQIDQIDARLARSLLKAPMDGLLFWHKQLPDEGAPVAQGQPLFEIASTDAHRLVILVDQTSLSWLKPGLRGELRLQGAADEVFEIALVSKTPVIRPGHAEGVFRIEAEFTQQSPVVLPGMSGVARLELEGQSVASVWGRHLIDWVKLKAWSLGFA